MKNSKKNIYFIGIGGIGMFGLAEYFLHNGYNVSGSDMTESHITKKLENLGAKIHIGHSENNIDDKVSMVVYTSAVKADNPEMIKAKSLNIRTIKRAEILGEIVNDKFLIAVAGTHGKTTTTAMIGKVLIDAGCDPLIFVGGNVSLFNGSAVRFGNGKYAVVEADEYDRSFLTLKPDVAVITNIDADHLDIYKDLDDIKNTFKQFIANSKSDSKIIYCGDDKNIASFINDTAGKKISYGFNEKNYFKIIDYKVKSNALNFSIMNSVSSYDNITLNLAGRHNALNSTAGFAVSKALNLDFNSFKKSIGEFKTVDRRLQLKYDANGIKVYDDYAHHPKEIESSLNGLKEMGNSRIIAVFQPHLFSRTRDFYKDFAKQLATADRVILLDIYPAREKPIEGVTSKLISDELIKMNKPVDYIQTNEKVLSSLISLVKTGDIVVFQGAGDITKLCDEFVNELKSHNN